MGKSLRNITIEKLTKFIGSKSKKQLLVDSGFLNLLSSIKSNYV